MFLFILSFHFDNEKIESLVLLLLLFLYDFSGFPSCSLSGILLIVSLNLSVAEEYIENVEEFTIVEFQIDAPLDTEAFTDDVKFTATDHVMHFTNGERSKELIATNGAAILTIKVLKDGTQIRDFIGFSG